VLQNSPATSPHQPVETCPPPPPTAPSTAPLKYTLHVRGLSKAGSKTQQARYRTALRVQCLTLFDAGIPIDIICKQWFVTKSAIYRWKQIARARGYNPDIDPCLLCSYIEDAPRSGCPTLQTYKTTQKMIKEICKDKERQNLSTCHLGGKIKVSATTA
jgi:hypothetical protein